MLSFIFRNSRELGFGFRYPSRESQRQIYRWLFILTYLLQGALFSGALVRQSPESGKWTGNVGTDLLLVLFFSIYCNTVHVQSVRTSYFIYCNVTYRLPSFHDYSVNFDDVITTSCIFINFYELVPKLLTEFYETYRLIYVLCCTGGQYHALLPISSEKLRCVS